MYIGTLYHMLITPKLTTIYAWPWAILSDVFSFSQIDLISGLIILIHVKVKVCAGSSSAFAASAARFTNSSFNNSHNSESRVSFVIAPQSLYI
jgi:hypothetical protein